MSEKSKNADRPEDCRSRIEFKRLVSRLTDLGLDPCWYKRGEQYRFHVHRGSNFWEDAATKLEAAKQAVFAWQEQGSPLFD